MDNVLLYFSLKYYGDWDKIYEALDLKEKIETNDLLDVSNSIPNNFISIINPLYPTSLKQIMKPPFICYFVGSVSLLHNYHQTISFIGGDNVNEYNILAVKRIIDGLIIENRTILVSDETPMQHLIIDHVIAKQGKIIIVTDENLEQFIQKDIWQKHKNIDYCDFVIISEKEISSMFKSLNSKDESTKAKIVIGLSKAVVLLETNDALKIESCIKLCLEESKQLFAIPQPIDENIYNSNKLLKEKAKLIESAMDILNKI